MRGFWLSLDGAEHFVGFAELPFFRAAPVQSLFRVRRPAAGHLRWPYLDVDLELDSIREPSRYPLVSRAAASRVREAATRARRARAPKSGAGSKRAARPARRAAR